MNVDPIEVKKFDDMAQQWWDKNGPCRPLHDLNPTRVDFILNRVDLHDKTVLDVGCGGGILTEALSQFCASIIGLDASEAAIRAAQAHATSGGLTIDYRCGELSALAESGMKADVLTCLELLEHVPDPEALLKTLADCCRPGGQLFVSTLNRTPCSFAKAIFGAEYLLRLLPKGTHQYAQFIRPSELAKWAQSAGFQVKAIKGMDYNPFTRAARLTSGVQVNYIMHMERI